MRWILAYIIVFITAVIVTALLAGYRARKDDVTPVARVGFPQPTGRDVLRHEASRMRNGGFKGAQIELKVYNGNI